MPGQGRLLAISSGRRSVIRWNAEVFAPLALLLKQLQLLLLLLLLR